MKKILLFALAAATLASCNNQPKYVIDGNVDGIGDMIYLFKESALIDSAAVKEGKFQFKGVVEQPGIYQLTDTRTNAQGAFALPLFVEPGTISITTDNDQQRHITGTPSNDASDNYKAQSQALVLEYQSPSTSDERRAAIEDEADLMTRTALDNNRDNLFGVALLPAVSYELSGAELAEEIGKFSPEMQKTTELTSMAAVAKQRVKSDLGMPYIDITQNNGEGQPVSLKSVIDAKGTKYTLVDFWASWCRPCMDELPYLKKTYDQYHSKGFEIYGVSLDSNREMWLSAVVKFSMNWVQVSDLNGFDCPAAKDYAVEAIPTNVLIDSEGKIIARNLRGEDLYQKIETLLGK